MSTRAIQLLESWIRSGTLRRTDTAPTGESYDFSAALQPTARGMLALAQSSLANTRVWVTEATTNEAARPVLRSPYEGRLDTLSPTVAVLTANPRGDWTPRFGDLDIRMLTLRCHGGHASLCVVLPYRKAGVISNASFTAIHIGHDGDVYVQSHNPSIEPLPYLLDVVGIGSDPHSVIYTRDGGGGINDHSIGFPGATEHLARELPKLDEQIARWISIQSN